MCIRAYHVKTKELYDKWTKQNRTFVWGYKIVRRGLCGTDISKKHPMSLFSILFSYLWKPGINKSNTRQIAFCKRKYTKSIYSIYRGIHVYLSKDYAKRMCRFIFNRPLIIRVKCYTSDLIGCDCRQQRAVFTQVTLSKAEYDKAII